jgi:hypothetical protein
MSLFVKEQFPLQSWSFNSGRDSKAYYELISSLSPCAKSPGGAPDQEIRVATLKLGNLVDRHD